jgi:hypothetical protein
MWNYVWIIRSTPFNIAPCNGLQGALLTKKSLYWRQDTIAPFSSEQKLTHKNCNLHKMYQILCCLPNHACRKSRLCWVNSLPPVRIADRLKITPGVFVWRIRNKKEVFKSDSLQLWDEVTVIILGSLPKFVSCWERIEKHATVSLWRQTRLFILFMQLTSMETVLCSLNT